MNDFEFWCVEIDRLLPSFLVKNGILQWCNLDELLNLNIFKQGVPVLIISNEKETQKTIRWNFSSSKGIPSTP